MQKILEWKKENFQQAIDKNKKINYDIENKSKSERRN